MNDADLDALLDRVNNFRKPNTLASSTTTTAVVGEKPQEPDAILDEIDLPPAKDIDHALMMYATVGNGTEIITKNLDDDDDDDDDDADDDEADDDENGSGREENGNDSAADNHNDGSEEDHDANSEGSAMVDAQSRSHTTHS